MNKCKYIDEFIKYCKLNFSLSNNTNRAYKSDLINFYEYLGGRKIGKESIENFYIYMVDKGLKPRTRKRRLVVLKLFCKFLFEKNMIEKNYFAEIKLKVKLPKDLPKVVSSESTNEILKYMYIEREKSNSKYKHKKILRDILIMEILIGTGMRVGELCNIKINDINLKEKYVLIRGKGNKERIVYINTKEILDNLKEYIKVWEPEEYLLKNKYNNKISEQAVGLMIKSYCKVLNIEEKITPHLYRHTFATSLAEQDVNLIYIQKILGHSSISTTEKYTHIMSSKHYEIMKNKNPRKKLRV